MSEISVEEVKAKLDRGDAVHLLDIRESAEVEICALPGAEHIPMMELFTGVKRTEAESTSEIVVYCHHGIRSFEAAQYLRMQGYAHARSMAGGIAAWADRVDPTMTSY